MEVAPHAEDSMHQPSRLLAAAGGLALLGAAYQAAGPSVAHTEAAAQIEPAPTQTQVMYFEQDTGAREIMLEKDLKILIRRTSAVSSSDF